LRDPGAEPDKKNAHGLGALRTATQVTTISVGIAQKGASRAAPWQGSPRMQARCAWMPRRNDAAANRLSSHSDP
jgi:hypothetical protein